ncbi:class I SAM-dependent methyltransferase [Sorangium sp. So ce176]|uniref:class I SAM-dependent methyltransferase n=1 Tax=Sorangium sp. So ce176 TaxID=3133286 RepID=UPI003F61F504
MKQVLEQLGSARLSHEVELSQLMAPLSPEEVLFCFLFIKSGSAEGFGEEPVRFKDLPSAPDRFWKAMALHVGALSGQFKPLPPSYLKDAWLRFVKERPGDEPLSLLEYYSLAAQLLSDTDRVFINHGYAFLNPAEAPSLAAWEEPSRLSIHLYHKLLGGQDFTGLDVVDMACGRGGGSLYLKQRKEARLVAGIDAVRTHVLLAREAHPSVDGVYFVHGRAEEIPLPTGAFDALIAVDAVFHFPLREFLHEAHRVVKPGGRCFLNSWGPPTWYMDLEGAVESCGWKLEHAEDITTGVLLAREQWRTHDMFTWVRSRPRKCRPEIYIEFDRMVMMPVEGRRYYNFHLTRLDQKAS